MGKQAEKEEILREILWQLRSIEPDPEFIRFARARLLVRLPDRKPRSWFAFSGWHWNNTRFAFAASIALLLFTLPKAFVLAEQSLPGDPFYPLKVAREKLSEVVLPEEREGTFAFWKLENRADEIIVAADKNHPGLEEAILNYQKMVESVSGSNSDEKLKLQLELDKQKFVESASASGRLEEFSTLVDFSEKRLEKLEESASPVTPPDIIDF